MNIRFDGLFLSDCHDVSVTLRKGKGEQEYSCSEKLSEYPDELVKKSSEAYCSFTDAQDFFTCTKNYYAVMTFIHAGIKHKAILVNEVARKAMCYVDMNGDGLIDLDDENLMYEFLFVHDRKNETYDMVMLNRYSRCIR